MEPQEITAPVPPEPREEGGRMKMLKRVLLGLVPVAFLMLIAGVAVALPPRITWTPNPLVMEGIAAGEQKTYTVTFKNTGYLPIPVTNQLRVVPEGDIAKYVTVVPPQFPPVVKRGQSVTFDVAVTVPGDAPIGVSDGTLVLKRVLPNGKVKEVWRAEALPTSVAVVWPTFLGGEELGFALQYPPGWQYSSDADGYELVGITGDSPPNYYMFRASVRRNVNPEHLTVVEWFDLNIKPFLDGRDTSRTDTAVDGYEAIHVTIVGNTGVSNNYYIARDADIVEIVYPSGNPSDNPTLLPLYDSILESFRFTL